MSQPKLVTAVELAELLQVSVETVWRYTRNAAIPFIQLANNKYRYNPDAVLHHLGLNSTASQTAGTVREAEPVYSTDKNYTYQDYLEFPDEEGYHYEILDGMLVREPAPSVVHQRISRRLQRILEDYLAALDPAGEVLNAPIDVTLSETNVIQPDLVYISGERASIVEESRINGAPHLAVEVLSRSTRAKDRIRKRVIYERLQIPHYWIVDPESATIEAYALVGGAYILRSSGCENGEFIHPDFPGLSFDLEGLWKRPGI